MKVYSKENLYFEENPYFKENPTPISLKEMFKWTEDWINLAFKRKNKGAGIKMYLRDVPRIYIEDFFKNREEERNNSVIVVLFDSEEPEYHDFHFEILRGSDDDKDDIAYDGDWSKIKLNFIEFIKTHPNDCYYLYIPDDDKLSQFMLEFYDILLEYNYQAMLISEVWSWMQL